ncbi:MAG: NnrS family protein [Wenzhouxiangellaceae bacterium]|nr:NnrS family protein [Wenzhouxiangellaceae bacterium]
MRNDAGPAWLQDGFRPFFLAAAMHAVVFMALWIVVVSGLGGLAGSQPVTWHMHEMLFGFVAAAVAGFTLTAVGHWTGHRPAAPRALAWLLGLWAAGRAAAWFPAADPGTGTGAALLVLDIAFLPVLAIVIAVPVLRSGNHRNLGVVALVGGLAAVHASFHVGTGVLRDGLLALDLVLILVAVIGGRITPRFSANWLARTGRDAERVQSFAALAAPALPALGLGAAAAARGTPLTLQALLALAAAALHLARWALWQTTAAWTNPLLAVLHIGYLWLIATLALRGLALLDARIANVAWVHAAGIGAIATMILAVMARATLGHTGRPLRLPPGAWVIFAAITLAAIARTLGALHVLPRLPSLWLSAGLWLLAFTGFAAVFGRMLRTPREDH